MHTSSPNYQLNSTLAIFQEEFCSYQISWPNRGEMSGPDQSQKSLNPGRGPRHRSGWRWRRPLRKWCGQDVALGSSFRRQSVRKEAVTSVLQLQENPELFWDLTCFRIELGSSLCLEPPGKNPSSSHALASALCFLEQVSQPYCARLLEPKEMVRYEFLLFEAVKFVIICYQAVEKWYISKCSIYQVMPFSIWTICFQVTHINFKECVLV